MSGLGTTGSTPVDGRGVLWSEEDEEFVGLCAELPSLIWLASSREAALDGIVKVVRQAVADMEAQGEAIPEPLAYRAGGFQRS